MSAKNRLNYEAYWMGRDKTHTSEMTLDIAVNATEVINRVNKLLEHPRFPDMVAPVRSGWRPVSVNDETLNSAEHSRHITAEAVDLGDDAARRIAVFCSTYIYLLEDIGLWMEDLRWTPSWVHLQIVPPASKRRIYIPSNAPALAKVLVIPKLAIRPVAVA